MYLVVFQHKKKRLNLEEILQKILNQNYLFIEKIDRLEKEILMEKIHIHQDDKIYFVII